MVVDVEAKLTVGVVVDDEAIAADISGVGVVIGDDLASAQVVVGRGEVDQAYQPHPLAH